MSASATSNRKIIDGLLKAMLVSSRAIDHVLETRSVEVSSGEVLSSSKVRIIRLLGEQGDQTSTLVARYLSVSKSAVSQITDTMVDEKLLVRKPSKTDRRGVNLRLTAKGKRIFEGMRREQRQFIRDSLKAKGAATAKRWQAALLEITESLAGSDEASAEYCLQCGAHSDSTCVLAGRESKCPFQQHELKMRKRAAARQT